MAGFKSFLRKSKKSKSPSNSSHGGTPALSRSGSHRHHHHHQIDDLEHVFNKFDANGDGKISCAELGSIMSSLGQSATEAELLAMVREVDSDGDGFIDLREFIELNTTGVDSDEALVNLREAFAVYDLDGNGSISAEELREVMKSLGDNCSLSDCRKMISGVDADGDGTISFDEFKVMMMTGARFNGVA